MEIKLPFQLLVAAEREDRDRIPPESVEILRMTLDRSDLGKSGSLNVLYPRHYVGDGPVCLNGITTRGVSVLMQCKNDPRSYFECILIIDGLAKVGTNPYQKLFNTLKRVKSEPPKAAPEQPAAPVKEPPVQRAKTGPKPARRRQPDVLLRRARDAYDRALIRSAQRTGEAEPIRKRIFELEKRAKRIKRLSAETEMTLKAAQRELQKIEREVLSPEETTDIQREISSIDEQLRTLSTAT